MSRYCTVAFGEMSGLTCASGRANVGRTHAHMHRVGEDPSVEIAGGIDRESPHLVARKKSGSTYCCSPEARAVLVCGGTAGYTANRPVGMPARH